MMKKLGDYQLLEELGQGGMGVVFKAQNPQGQICAVKLLSKLQSSSQTILRFRQESKILFQLNHPNIVRFIDSGMDNEMYFLAMELIDGHSLDKFLNHKAMPWQQAISVVSTLAFALHYAHQQGIIHRDIKPTNIIIRSRDRQPVLLDFGLAKALDSDMQLTLSGAIMGTPNYMSPEQMEGKISKIGPHTDVYALGCILYELLTGRQVVSCKRYQEVFNAITRENPPAPNTIIAEIPELLNNICLKMLAKQPQDRYLSVEIFLQDIQKFSGNVSPPLKITPNQQLPVVKRDTPTTTGNQVSNLKVGDFLGIYRIEQELGRGGMGVVYKAYDTRLDRTVAVKLLLAQWDEKKTKRFMREAKAVASLDHPNVVKLFDVFTTPKNYLVMEYVEGMTLAGMIKQKKINTRKAVQIIHKVAVAIHFAHEKGIIHRDIKPSNVMIDLQGEPKIMDFGLAKVDDDQHLTVSRDMLGTPAYMSPEQLDNKKIDPRTDVYSIGATLYEVLTKKTPFKGTSVFITINKIINEVPKAPKFFNAKITSDLESICLKCLEKKPRNRYDDALQLANDLQSYLANKAISAKPSTIWSAVPRWVTNNKTTAILLAFCLLVISNIVFISAFLTKDKNNTENKNTSSSKREDKQNKDLKKQNKNATVNNKSSKKNKPKVLFNRPNKWPPELWEKCWHEQEGVDFSRREWKILTPQEQAKYTRKYQEWYARKVNLPVSKVIKLEDKRNQKDMKKYPLIKNLKGISIKMQLVPPGRFKGRLVKAFWMSTTEFTQDQWLFYGGKHRPELFVGGQFPVVSIALGRIKRDLKAGGIFKLPTTVQWAYASSSGSSYRYYWGDTYKKNMANILEHWQALGLPPRCNRVGEFPPNAFGLYDMIGNVSEWLRESEIDRKGIKHVVGGNFQYPLGKIGIHTFKKNVHTYYWGFRVVEEIP